MVFAPFLRLDNLLNFLDTETIYWLCISLNLKNAAFWVVECVVCWLYPILGFDPLSVPFVSNKIRLYIKFVVPIFCIRIANTYAKQSSLTLTKELPYSMRLSTSNSLIGFSLLLLIKAMIYVWKERIRLTKNPTRTILNTLFYSPLNRMWNL